MNRYHVSLSEKSVREALADYIQKEGYPHLSRNEVVYFSHDLITGEMLVEMAYPIPDASSDSDGDEIEPFYASSADYLKAQTK